MWWLTTLALAGAYTFDFEKNQIMGDRTPGPLLQALGTRSEALNACLDDVQKAFDEVGRVPAADIEVSATGELTKFRFGLPALTSVDACLQEAVKDLEVPSGGHRFGVVLVRRTGEATPKDSFTTESDGLRAVLTAHAEGLDNLHANVVVTATERRAFGDHAVVLHASRYRPDGTGTHTATWTEPNHEVTCVEAGETITLEGSLARSDRPRAGEVLRAKVVLQHGPCGTEADAERMVVGAVEMRGGAVTVWSAADLDSRPPPFRSGD